MTCRIPVRVSERPDVPDNVPVLGMFYLYVSDACNLACRHCWITPEIEGKSGNDKNVFVDLEQLQKTVQEAKTLGLSAIKLTGGEPFLHPDIDSVIRLASNEKLGLVVETNGTLITGDMARFIKKMCPEAFISVSLDGSTPEVNDDLRGINGSFTAAVKGIRNLVEAGFHPQIIMSVHRGNMHDMENVVRFAVSVGAGSVKFNPVNLCGRALDMKEKGELFSLKEILELKTYVLGELRKIFDIPVFIMMPPAMLSVGELLNKGHNTGQCHILNIMGILGSGTLALCGIGRHIPELCFGNMAQDSIRDVWLNNKILADLRHRLMNESFPGICGHCIHARQCLMHCLAQNYMDSGKLPSPSMICVEADKSGWFPKSRLKTI